MSLLQKWCYIFFLVQCFCRQSRSAESPSKGGATGSFGPAQRAVCTLGVQLCTMQCRFGTQTLLIGGCVQNACWFIVLTVSFHSSVIQNTFREWNVFIDHLCLHLIVGYFACFCCLLVCLFLHANQIICIIRKLRKIYNKGNKSLSPFWQNYKKQGTWKKRIFLVVCML